jgi:tetratricopeptide (TPR) repeat protein
MAPEQIRGETPGPGTDLWALGVLLHEMVAGRRPFEGETPEEIYRLIADRDPEPLPAPFGAIGARALAKDPERRYPSVAAFRRDLERVWREPRARSPRTRGAWALALGGAAALAAAVTLAVVGRRPLEPSQEQAETLPIGLALEKSERDIQEHTRALLANPRDLGHLVGRAAALVARGGVKRGRGQNPLGDYADAERDLARALEHAPGAAEALFERGKLRVFAGSFKWRFGLDPVADLLGAEADLDRVLDRPGAQAWRGYARYFRAVHAADQGSDPRPLLEAAERDMTPARDAETLLRRARVRARLGKLGDAEQDFAEGLRLRPDHYVGWTWRGRAHLEAGDLAAAEGFLAHALAVEPRHAEAWETRASVRHARGNFTGAAADFKEAIRLNPSLEPLLREKLVDAETRSGPGQPR